MTTTTEKVRQLAPHWGVMFALMLALLAVVERLAGEVPFWGSLLLVSVVAFGYPVVVRFLGVEPAVWRRE